MLGKRHVVRLALTCLLSEGHLLLEDVPGTGKTMLARALANTVAGQPRPDPVHPRPAALRRHRRDRLRPAQGHLRVPPRPDLPHDRAGRRDQPGLAQDPVGAARGDGGGPGHRRRRRPLGRPAVHGHRHPEPDRAGRHLPAARGPARPVPDEDLGRLPGPRGHRRAARQRRGPRPRLAGHAGHHRRRRRPDERPRRRGVRRPGRGRLRRRARRGVAPPAARQARPVAARLPGPHPGRQDLGGGRRPRPRRARRHQGARRAGAVATACCSTPRRSSAASASQTVIGRLLDSVAPPTDRVA